MKSLLKSLEYAACFILGYFLVTNAFDSTSKEETEYAVSKLEDKISDLEYEIRDLNYTISDMDYHGRRWKTQTKC